MHYLILVENTLRSFQEIIILNQIGLPVEYIALIVAVDRILDMARTSLNVTSDLVVVKIVDQLEKKTTPATPS